MALIGTICQGLSYLASPLSAAVAKRYPKYQRLQIWIGWPICIGSLVAGSFVDTLGGLIATQGVMYGTGFVMLTYPIVSMLDEWWVLRKGMAFGVLSSASGASGVVMPFIIEALLNRYGYKTTLRAMAAGMAILTGPLLPFLRGRLPPAEQSAMPKANWAFFNEPLFWIYCVSTFLYGLGFFFPIVYLPSYAAALGLGSSSGATLLAVMAIAQVMGQFAVGYLSDKKISVNGLAIVCVAFATIASLALWGMAKSLAPLIVFGMLYGFFGYGFTSQRVSMGREVGDTGIATFSILIFLQGIGNILVGPISAALIGRDVSVGKYGAGKYQSLVIFTGICMFASAMVIALWHLRPTRLAGVSVRNE